MKVFALSLAALSMGGCIMNLHGGTPGSGKLVTVNRSETGFTKVLNEGSADVTVTVGKAFSIKVTIDDNLEKHLITKVEGGELVIKNDESIDPTKCHVDITMPAIESYKIDGAGDATITGIAGSSFKGQIDGAGDLKLSGDAKTIELGIDGAGSINAYDLHGEEVTATIDGAGDIETSAKATLKASVDGAGSIRYKGDPKVTEDVSGAGSVSKT